MSKLKAEKNVRALLVDDNEVSRKLAGGVLKYLGIDVDEANSGYMAIDMLKENRYDIIFIDHLMPQLDGIETARQIRALDEYHKKVPLIAMTAGAGEDGREHYIANGFDDFISKPIEIKKLAEVLARWTFPDEKILEIEGLDEAFAVGVAGGSEEYISVLRIFIRTTTQKIPVMRKYYEEKDWDAFRIEIHALKSAVGFIGSKEMFNTAKALEYAAKERSDEAIERDFEPFMIDLENMIFNIAQRLNQEINAKNNE